MKNDYAVAKLVWWTLILEDDLAPLQIGELPICLVNW
uniref:Uncharacterized protein n=1 Tax=Arundo donax TaxID=35708 RepID=A0A0A9B701_ARUDO